MGSIGSKKSAGAPGNFVAHEARGNTKRNTCAGLVCQSLETSREVTVLAPAWLSLALVKTEI